MMTKAGWSRAALATAMAISLWIVPDARAHVELAATLDTANEVPAPVGVSASAGGVVSFAYEPDTKMLMYTFTVTLHDLTGTPVAAHIHQAPPGTAGAIVIPLDPAATTATVGPLTTAQETALYKGLLYINYHTPQNLSGEVRGQITLVPGACGCSASPKHGKFVKCVRKAIKGIEDKAERKEDAIKSLRKASAKSSCGKKKGPKKSVACCLPRNPEENIVTDALCIPAKEAKCGALGGTSQGATSTCFPNPCSPSGAFLDDFAF